MKWGLSILLLILCAGTINAAPPAQESVTVEPGTLELQGGFYCAAQTDCTTTHETSYQDSPLHWGITEKLEYSFPLRLKYLVKSAESFQLYVGTGVFELSYSSVSGVNTLSGVDVGGKLFLPGGDSFAGSIQMKQGALVTGEESPALYFRGKAQYALQLSSSDFINVFWKQPMDPTDSHSSTTGLGYQMALNSSVDLQVALLRDHLQHTGLGGNLWFRF